jgi:hypothetical protein
MNRTSRTGQSRSALTVWSIAVALVIASRPLESPDLWWDLARGREVNTTRTLDPSHNLLTLDQASEASWLGGSFFHLVWSIGGIFALAAIPLAATFAVRTGVLRLASPASRLFAVTTVFPVTVLATRAGLEPTAALWDLLFLCGLWLILRHRGTSRRILWGLAALFLAWANLGTGPVWGLLLVMLWPGALNGRLAAVVLSIVAGMATPRGALTWLDSIKLFAPSAFVPSAALEDRWRSVLTAGWDVSLAAAGLLWAIAAAALLRRRSARTLADGVMLLVPLAAVLMSRANIPLAALWSSLGALTLMRNDTENVTAARPSWLRPVVALVTAVALLDACGMVSPASSTIGWGLSQAIDPRLLDIADSVPGNERAVAWAADSRSAGVAAWARTNTKLVDHPRRALLGGRSARHAAMRRDLTSAHRSRYRLDDGSWGGWGRPFAEWKVDVLFVPAEASDLHRGLLETPWKLIKLDSPTVPYASAENPRFDRAVVDVLLQQGFVEAGAWRPSIDVYDPQGWRIEASSLLGLGPEAAPAVRQARFFRAVKLPMAALRALEPVRLGGGSAAVRAEFFACQQAAALEEFNETGAISLFRRLVLDDVTPGSESWRRARDLYRSGQIDAAIQALGRGSEELYALGLMQREVGRVDEARRAFESALTGESPALKIAARYWLNQMSPENKDPMAFQ